MRCEDVRDRMAAFVRWQLPSAESRSVARHIARCADCRLWYEEVVSLAEVWQDEDVIADLDLVSPVLDRLRTSSLAAVDRRVGTVVGRSRTRAEAWAVPGRTTLLHYAIAASVAAILFQLGVFQHTGDLAHHGAALSGQVTRLTHMLVGH
jgi:hypothetical protein